MKRVEDIYYYSFGDRLNDERNSYFYTAYHGREFFDFWQASRKIPITLKRDKLPASLFSQSNIEEGVVTTALASAEGILADELFDYLYKSMNTEGFTPSVSGHLKKLVKRFEVTKRVYSRYQGNKYQAVEKTAFKALGLYLKLAFLFSEAYNLTRSLPYLNAMLKIVDTISSQISTLDDSYFSYLDELMAKEIKYVFELSDEMGGVI